MGEGVACLIFTLEAKKIDTVTSVKLNRKYQFLPSNTQRDFKGRGQKVVDLDEVAHFEYLIWICAV